MPGELRKCGSTFLPGGVCARRRVLLLLCVISPIATAFSNRLSGDAILQNRLAHRLLHLLHSLSPRHSKSAMSVLPSHACATAVLLTMLELAGHASSVPGDPDGRALLQTARESIAAYHGAASESSPVLRVVYFHPSDRDPLPEYAERLDRILNDISDFYRDGLKRFGIENKGIPLEKKDGRLVLHVVKGKLPASEYKHESGNQTAAEIRQALKGKMEFDREHVLVLYGLCRKEPDGRYVFDAPYYGRGSQRSGLCHAADCELLDPNLLGETGKKIVYTEHYYPRLEQTVAKFNSMYLGGTAHELGHGLGLPHDSGAPEEKKFGTSLMGAGNLTYRQEIWSKGAPVFLTRASALQLASHPLITGSNRGRWDEIKGGFADLRFSAEGSDLKIDGKAFGEIPPYGVIAYVWPESEPTDHKARTFPVVLKDGAFSLTLTGLRPDSYHLELAALHVNGGTTRKSLALDFDDTGSPDVAALNGDSTQPSNVEQAVAAVLNGYENARALVTDQAIAAAPTEEAKRKLRVLRAVLDPPAPIDLASVATDTAYLSDATWTDARVGWGQVARNHNWFDKRIQNGVFLFLRGKFYDKGLYAHSPSRYAFALDGRWKIFTAAIGLRDGALKQGSAVFVVRGDGKELYRSPILRIRQSQDVKLDITGVKELELIARGGEGHNHNSWAIWVEPKVMR
jgi:NPCBM/NEW2 domain